MGHTLKSLVMLIGLICCTTYAQDEFKIAESTMEFDLPIEFELPIELVELHGMALNLSEGLCDHTTEDPIYGMHLTVEIAEQQEVMYVHLGPVWAVSVWTEGIEGQPVKLTAFRTEKLPENHFIAKELEWDGQKAVFRDGYLKPFWANRYEREIW